MGRITFKHLFLFFTIMFLVIFFCTKHRWCCCENEDGIALNNISVILKTAKTKPLPISLLKLMAVFVLQI